MQAQGFIWVCTLETELLQIYLRSWNAMSYYQSSISYYDPGANQGHPSVLNPVEMCIAIWASNLIMRVQLRASYSAHLVGFTENWSGSRSTQSFGPFPIIWSSC